MLKISILGSLLSVSLNLSAIFAAPIVSEAEQQLTFSQIQASKDLTGTACFGKYTCAVLDVPLDYHKPAGVRAQIPLMRHAATTTPYKGMVLFNPGGPGFSSINYFLSNGYSYLTGVTGSNYDLVMWEPRGTGASMTSANCSLDPDLTGSYKRDTAESYLAQTTKSWYQHQYDNAKTVGQECMSSIGNITSAGPHMVTSVVAQGMVSILDVYAGSKEGKSITNATMLNYHGYSYGTFLGETFASMYPSRVGKMVLDGVNDPDDWISTGELTSTLNDANDAFATFFVFCHEAGDKCAFNTGKSAKDIFVRFQTLLNRLDSQKAYDQKWANASIIVTALHGLKYISFTVMRAANGGYAHLASVLATLEKYAVNLSTRLISSSSPDSYVDVTDPWFYGFHCGDQNSKFYNRSIDEMTAVISKLSQSSFMGVEGLAPNVIRCAGSSIKNDDAHIGPFGGVTANPMLFVGNTFDPFTPARNGAKGAAMYKGAQLLTVDGIAHSTPQTLNACAIKKIKAYFQDGTLPGADNYCAVEVSPWSVNLTQPINMTGDFAAVRDLVHSLRDKAPKTIFPYAPGMSKVLWT